MNVVPTLGLDHGGGVTKVTVTRPDGSTLIVQDSAGNDVFVTAVFKDPKTGQYLFSYDAMNAGIAEPDHLAMDYKRHLGDETKRFFKGTASAKDVATLLLTHIRERAAATVGQTVVDCCVTMPFVWSDVAKRNYLAAIEQAGLKPIPAGEGGMGVLAEPTAAALAYADLKQLGKSGTIVLVVDVGSTTTDVSCVKLDANTAEVLGGHGDPNLGGFNIQNDLREMILRQAVQEGILRPADLEKFKTISEHRVSLMRSVEDALKALMTRPDTRVPITFGAKPGIVKITQSLYEREILEPYIKRICDCIDRAKANAMAQGKAITIDYLMPAGGPCRNPFIQSRIAKHVGIPAKNDIDPIRAIVMGAAKHAYWLMSQREGAMGSLPYIIKPRECVPHDIGIIVVVKESLSLRMESLVIFQKGQTVPLTKTINLYLLEDHQSGVTCRFVQCDGNGQPLEACHALGEVILQGLPSEAIRTARLQIKATFDEAAMVTMEVKDLVSGLCKQVQFAAPKLEAPQNAA